MNIIYIILSVILVFLVINRMFDFVSIAVLSFCLYTSNCAINNIFIEGNYYPHDGITENLYLIIFIQQLLMIVFLKLFSRNQKYFIHVKGSCLNKNVKLFDNVYWISVLGISICYLFYVVVYCVGPSIFFSYASKTDISEQLGLGYGLVVWLGTIGFTYGIKNKKNIIVCLSSVIIFVTVLFGSRASLATCFVIWIWFKYKDMIGLHSNFRALNIKILCLCMAFAFILIGYKTIYRDARALNGAKILRNITNTEIITNDLLDIGEVRVNLSLYNYVIDRKISFLPEDILARLFTIFPVIYKLLPINISVRFSKHIKEKLFNSKWGLASTFWGEIFAIGGVGLVLLVTFFWLYSINQVELLLRLDNKF